MSSASHLLCPSWINVQHGENASHTSHMHRSFSCRASETRNGVFNSAQLQAAHGTTSIESYQSHLSLSTNLDSTYSVRHGSVRSIHCTRATAVNRVEAGAGDLDKKAPRKMNEEEDEDLLTDDDELELDEKTEVSSEEGEDFDDDDDDEDSQEGEGGGEREWIEEDEEQDVQLGDGGQGGGIIRPELEWGRLALTLAQQLVEEGRGGEGEEPLAIYAFKVDAGRGIIRLRLDKPSDRYGSPSVEEIEYFSRKYSRQLDEAVTAGTMRADFALEVSSPGAERVVKVPSELERFSALPMYVKYRQRVEDRKVEEEEEEEILELVGVDEESGSATWKVANVRINREVAGKGRGLTKRQRERRIRVLFGDIMIVRVFVDI